VRDNQLITAANDPEYRPSEDYYYTDAISDHAAKFIREHKRDQAGRPFLLYVPYTAAHWPMHARERDIAKYKGKYDNGYGPVRAARWAKQKQLGIADAAWGLAPQAGDWAKVKNKEFEIRCMEVYAAMLTVMDEGIGRIVAELKATGQYENTVICYLQDNGGCAETNGRTGAFTPRPSAPTSPPMARDAQQFSSRPDQTRDGYPVRGGSGVIPGPADTYVAYGGDWANVSNTPFREYKHWVHEGGIATPLIVHWPAGISTARRGKIDAQPGHLIDLMATCVDLSGAHYPTKFNGETITPMEGVSLRPALQGKSLQRAQPIFWEHEGNRAVREDRWKLVSKFPGGWELYDMTADRTEAHDLAAKEPVRLKAMIASYHAWAKRAHVVPWPANPANGANKKKGAAVKSGEE
jgi:arylsulfatase